MPNPKYGYQPSTGSFYVWTPTMASRDDIVPCDAMPDQTDGQGAGAPPVNEDSSGDLASMSKAALLDLAKEKGVKAVPAMAKADIIAAIEAGADAN